jgi:uncharacterized membrane protein
MILIKKKLGYYPFFIIILENNNIIYQTVYPNNLLARFKFKIETLMT